MIARQRSPQGKSYDTAVFVLRHDQGNSLYIGFDEKGERLIALPVYRRACGGWMATSLFIDPSDSGMIERGKLLGYDWALDHDLLSMVVTDQEIPAHLLENCRKIQAESFFPERKEILTREDAERLLTTAGGFHDGCIEEVTEDGTFTRIVLSVWGGRIVFLAEDAQLTPYCKEGFGALGQIFSADILFKDGRILFGGSEMNHTPDAPVPKSCLFSAKRLFYIPEAE